MRRWVAFVWIAGALAACSAEPRPAGAGLAGPRAPAAPDARPEAGPDAAAVATPPAAPRGDRHARAAARRSHVVKRARGTIARSDDRAIVVSRSGAPPLTLHVGPGTAVTLDGGPAQAEALPRGADVRAAYRVEDGGRPTAITIEAQRPVRAEPGSGVGGSWETSPEPDPAGGG